MKEVILKIFVARFYKINIGFFLFFFLLLFGIVDAQSTVYFHHSIMRAAVNSPSILLVLMGVWLLYALKCAGFMMRTLKDPANIFLAELEAISARRQYTLMFLCQSLLFLPVTAYAILTAAVALQELSIATLLAIVCFIILLLHFSAKLYQRQIHYHIEPVWMRYIPALTRQGKPRSLHLFLLHFSLAKHKRTLFVLKIVSLLLLQAVVAFNKAELSKESVCFFMMIIIAAHALIPYYYVRFTEGLAWLRNLPFSKGKRFVLYAVPYALLFLPELVFLLLHVHYAITISVILSMYLLAVAQLCFFTALLYMPRLQEERYMLWVLAIFIGSMILLAGISLPLYALATFIAAFGLFALRYERFELLHEKED